VISLFDMQLFHVSEAAKALPQEKRSIYRERVTAPGKSGSAKLPMATMTCPGKPVLSQ
jgi:hypothetical protein